MQKTNHQAGQSALRVVIAGSVDHGKSTLVGRLLHETGTLPDGKVEAVRAACVKRGVDFEWAFLTDALQAERDQNVTIDVAQIGLITPNRKVVLVDAPGHEEFLKNMITGAATADAALLLVAADEGWREQSRRHAYLLSFLGLKQVVVIVNKMDRANYEQSTLQRIEDEGRAFLKGIGIEPTAFVPVSAREGANISAPADAMPWYRGPTVLSAIDAFQPPPVLDDQPLRFVVQDVYREGDRRVVAGRIEAGSLKRGDAIVFWPYHKAATVASIERWPEQVDEAGAGDSIGIVLEESLFVERGYVASHPERAPMVSNRLRGSLFWIGRESLSVGRDCRVKLVTQDVAGQVSALGRIFDPGSKSETDPTVTALPRHAAGEVTLTLRTPLVFDRLDRVAATGRFVLQHGHEIVGGGIVTEGDYADERREAKSANVTETTGTITAEDRSRRNGHRGGVVWFTGLSGAGKSTLARVVEGELFARGMQVSVLDGDNLRRGLNSDLGFAPTDRVENIRRAAEVARLLAEAGTIVIVALISPYRVDRMHARRIALEGGCDFIEVHVDAPLEVCEQRDPKALYRKARAGLIKEFTGIDAPYETPDDAEVIVHTHQAGVRESADTLVAFLLQRLVDSGNGGSRP